MRFLNDLKQTSSYGLAAAILLFFLPWPRFSWDIWPQALLHVTVFGIIFSLLKNNRLLYCKALFMPLSLLGLAAVISYIFNQNSAVMRDGIMVLLDSILLAVSAVALSEKDKHTVISLSLLSGVLLSSAFLLRPLLNTWGLGIDSSAYLEASVNFNVFAGYLLLLLPLSFIYWNKGGFSAKAVSFIILTALISTGSRASSVIALCLLYIFMFKRSKAHKHAFLFITLAVFSAFTILLLFYKSSYSQSVFDRAMWWKTAVVMFLDNPLTGIGWGNFGDLFLFYRPGRFLNSVYAHDLPLQLAAETGVLGLAAFILLIYSFYRSAAIRTTNDIPGNSITLPVLLSVSGFLVYSLVDFGFYIPSIMCLFFFLLGTVFSPTMPIAFKIGKRSILYYSLFFAVCAASIMPAAAALFFTRGVINYNAGDNSNAKLNISRSLMLDRYNWRARTMLAQAHFSDFARSRSIESLSSAINEQREAVQLFPRSARLNSDLGWLYFESGKYTEALNYMNAASKCDRYNSRYIDSIKYISGSSSRSVTVTLPEGQAGRK